MSDEAIRHKSEYDQSYEKNNIVKKHIPFNKNNPDDAKMLDWLDQQKNVTRYVKDLITDDMPGK